MICMTLDEQEEVLRHWESLDGKMSDDIREECAEAIASSDWTKAQWMDYLMPIPEKVGERYRKAMRLLFEKKMITEQCLQEEIELSKRMSPAALTKNGKFLMNWYREEEKMDFPTLRGAL
jgi:hypothetical protein